MKEYESACLLIEMYISFETCWGRNFLTRLLSIWKGKRKWYADGSLPPTMQLASCFIFGASRNIQDYLNVKQKHKILQINNTKKLETRQGVKYV